MLQIKSEPDILTFYGQPVTKIENGDFYVHLGVVQAPTNQSMLAVNYRISKATEIVYLHQGSTKSALSGVSPTANRNIVLCYDLPTYIYGLDTIHVNATDLDRLEVKYRGHLRNLQSLPSSVASPAVYLSMGVLPAVAERDVEILGLLGQLAQCPRDLQAVSDIVQDGLEKFDLTFQGWSGLARKTAMIYNIQDPLELMQEPWSSERWRTFCRKIVTDYWISTLHESSKSYSTLDLLDVSRLRLDSPHPIWSAASRDSVGTSQAVYQMWIILGCYNTQQRLAKMNKVKSPNCILCSDVSDTPQIEDRVHFLLSCPALSETRENFLCQLVNLSPVVTNYIEVSSQFLLCLLDPLSPMVPEELRNSWYDEEEIYKWSRKFCFSMHKRRTALMESTSETN